MFTNEALASLNWSSVSQDKATTFLVKELFLHWFHTMDVIR